MAKQQIVTVCPFKLPPNSVVIFGKNRLEKDVVKQLISQVKSGQGELRHPAEPPEAGTKYILLPPTLTQQIPQTREKAVRLPLTSGGKSITSQSQSSSRAKPSKEEEDQTRAGDWIRCKNDSMKIKKVNKNETVKDDPCLPDATFLSIKGDKNAFFCSVEEGKYKLNPTDPLTTCNKKACSFQSSSSQDLFLDYETDPADETLCSDLCPGSDIIPRRENFQLSYCSSFATGIEDANKYKKHVTTNVVKNNPENGTFNKKHDAVMDERRENFEGSSVHIHQGSDTSKNVQIKETDKAVINTHTNCVKEESKVFENVVEDELKNSGNGDDFLDDFQHDEEEQEEGEDEEKNDKEEEEEGAEEENDKGKVAAFPKLTLYEFIIEKHNMSSFTCKNCKMVFSSRADAMDHTVIHSPYRCLACDVTFDNCREMKDHERVIHNEVIHCGSCFFKTKKRCVYRKHLKTHNLKRITHMVCYICGQMIRIWKQLDDHMESAHGILKRLEEDNFQCPLCNSILRTIALLRAHIRKHKGKWKWCPKEGCSFKALLPRMVKEHFDSVHLSYKPVPCPIEGCKVRFKRNATASLDEHLNVVHYKIRQFWCQTCGKAFLSQKHLQVHIRIHSDKMYYSCKFCVYQCKQSASLKWHMKTKHPEEIIKEPERGEDLLKLKPGRKSKQRDTTSKRKKVAETPGTRRGRKRRNVSESDTDNTDSEYLGSEHGSLDTGEGGHQAGRFDRTKIRTSSRKRKKLIYISDEEEEES